MSPDEESFECKIKVLEFGLRVEGGVNITQRNKSINLSQDNLLLKGRLEAERPARSSSHTASVRV